jgi:4-hydroxy-tetrahydrodipicolinate synthase
MYQGVIAPAVTLLQRDGTIDATANCAHADFVIESGVDGLYVLGMTGEFMHFNLREREGLVATIVEHVDKRLPVIVGAATTATREAVRLCRHAQGVGADAVTVTTPYFWTLSDREVIGHFATIATAVDIPVFIYNVPRYSGINISNEILVTLLREHPNIIGIFDSVDSMDHLRTRIDAVRSMNPNFCVFTGNDGQLLTTLQLGGNGTVPATANMAPNVHVDMVKAYESGDYGAAIECFQKLSKSLDVFMVPGSFHSVIKEAMVILGLAQSSTVRSPALPLTPESRARLREVLVKAGLVAMQGRE